MSGAPVSMTPNDGSEPSRRRAWVYLWVALLASLCIYILAFILGSLGTPLKLRANWILLAGAVNYAIDLLVLPLVFLVRGRFCTKPPRRCRLEHLIPAVSIVFIANATLGVLAIIAHMFL